jgi:hypothetical protein
MGVQGVAIELSAPTAATLTKLKKKVKEKKIETPKISYYVHYYDIGTTEGFLKQQLIVLIIKQK